MPGLFTIALYYLVLITVLTGWLFEGKRRKWKIGGLLALTVCWCAWSFHGRPVARLTVLPLNGGHAVYVQGPGRDNDWLINCGGESSVENVVKPFLRAQGVNRLSNFLLTHGEISYTGGAKSIHEIFRPANLYAGALHFRSPAYNDFQAATHGVFAWRKPLQAGDKAGPFTVLYPGPENHFPKAEDNPLVLRAEVSGTKVLLLSDLGRAGQNELLSHSIDLRADIVIAGLPVEGEPLSDTLLESIQPQVVIIADADYPATRKAGNRLRERLARHHIPVIYTSEANAATLEIRQDHWDLRAMDGTKIHSASTGK
jgi:competence protein ComEC